MSYYGAWVEHNCDIYRGNNSDLRCVIYMGWGAKTCNSEIGYVIFGGRGWSIIVTFIM